MNENEPDTFLGTDPIYYRRIIEVHGFAVGCSEGAVHLLGVMTIQAATRLLQAT